MQHDDIINLPSPPPLPQGRKMWIYQPHNLCYAPCIILLQSRKCFMDVLKKYYETVFHFTDRHAVL